jgi:iron complex outermembrane recepter protein
VMPGSPWKVEESVLEAYLMGKFNADWGSLPVSGNFGVRVVNNETTSSGFETVNGGAFQEVSIDNDYTEVLPSVNVMLKIGEDTQLRFGAARVISRPPLDELRATRQLWNTTPPPTGSGGNPMLEPFLGTQVDVSYEWYFKPESLIALAVFYKDVDNHIGYTTDPVVIDNVTYAVTGPFNGDGGTVAGAEFTFQMPFTQYFGIYMNYAFVDSDVNEFYPVTNPLPVEGFAQDTAAVDLWLSIVGLEARLGYKYHSPYTVIAGWNGGDVRELSQESLFDFSLSYQMNESFGIRFQVNNLSDEPLRISRDNNLQRLGSFDVYGRRALLDFTFKY